MPKYKLYRLYFHFITFQITTNALVLAQPSNSDQTLCQLHFKVQIRFATKEPPSPLYIGGVEMISSKVFVFNSFLIAV